MVSVGSVLVGRASTRSWTDCPGASPARRHSNSNPQLILSPTAPTDKVGCRQGKIGEEEERKSESLYATGRSGGVVQALREPTISYPVVRPSQGTRPCICWNRRYYVVERSPLIAVRAAGYEPYPSVVTVSQTRMESTQLMEGTGNDGHTRELAFGSVPGPTWIEGVSKMDTLGRKGRGQRPRFDSTGRVWHVPPPPPIRPFDDVSRVPRHMEINRRTVIGFVAIATILIVASVVFIVTHQ